jgi:hypothetical protein
MRQKTGKSEHVPDVSGFRGRIAVTVNSSLSADW